MSASKEATTSDFDNVGLIFAAIAIGILFIASVLLLLPAVLFCGLLTCSLLTIALNCERKVIHQLLISAVVLWTIWALLWGIPFIGTDSDLYVGLGFKYFTTELSSTVTRLLTDLNSFLPKRFRIRSMSVSFLRSYIWLPVLLAPPAAALALRSGKVSLAKFNLPSLRGAQAFPFRFNWKLINLFCLANVTAIWFGKMYLGRALFEPALEIGLAVLFIAILMLVSDLILSDKALKIAKDRCDVGYFKRGGFGPFGLTIKQLQHHVHILGASGFGKSVLLMILIRFRINQGHGLFYIDLKADFETLQSIVSCCKEAGRLEDLMILSSGHPKLSVPYNVVARGNANEICDRIISSLTWTESFYRDQCDGILQKILLGLVEARNLNRLSFHLGDVLRALKDPDYLAEINQLIPDQPKFEPIHQALAEVDAYIRNTEQVKNLQGLKTQLEKILLSEFGHLLSNSSSGGIDIFRAAREGQIVVVFLDSRRYSVAAPALGKIIIEDLKAASSQLEDEVAKSDLKPFGVVIDEFADLAQPNFIKFQDRARSSGMGIVVAHQELADLISVSPEFPVRLNHLSSTTFIFQTKGKDGAESIASTAGTKLSIKETERSSRGFFAFDFRTGEKSVREVEEFLIHPNEIKSLTVGECAMITKYPVSNAGILQIAPPIAATTNRADTVSALAAIAHKFRPNQAQVSSEPKNKVKIQDRF